MQSRLIFVLLSIIATMMLAAAGAAQEPLRQEPGAKPKPARSGQKAVDDANKRETESLPETSEEQLHRAITSLTSQIDTLAAELQKLRKETQRSSSTLELLLYEERLVRLEEKIDGALDRKAQLDAREQEIQRRMRNTQQEVALRGGLRRDEAEAALRAELQRALEDARSQQAAYQQRIAELQAQADRLRARVESLRKKLEPPEEKDEKQ